MSLNIFYNILLSLQYNFNKRLCDKIFGINSDHIYPKWLSSDGNILCFLTRLDDNNRDNLLEYVSQSLSDTQ
jgi:hypothetical protein